MIKNKGFEHVSKLSKNAEVTKQAFHCLKALNIHGFLRKLTRADNRSGHSTQRKKSPPIHHPGHRRLPSPGTQVSWSQCFCTALSATRSPSQEEGVKVTKNTVVSDLSTLQHPFGAF